MKLKKMRKRKGLTQAKLAKMTGLSLQTIKFYEEKKRDIDEAKIKTIAELTSALDCEVVDILEDEKLIQKLERGKK